MLITIDLPVKDEMEKKILQHYLKIQWELFLKYYSIPEYKINPDVEKEIISQKKEDYIEINDIDELLEMIE